MIVKNLESMNT